MGMTHLENAVLRELKVVAKNPKLKKADIMEWSTGKVEVQEGETLYFLPVLKVNVAVKNP